VTRLYHLSGVFLVLSLFLGCEERSHPTPVVVHVLRDASASFAKNLRQADLEFGSSKARLSSGRWMMIATNEGDSYPALVKRLAPTTEDLVVLNSLSDLPDVAAVKDHVGRPQFICGGAPAYIPDWVSGEQREATEIYLRFLLVHCAGSGTH
jgi:hypothetical protein